MSGWIQRPDIGAGSAFSVLLLGIATVATSIVARFGLKGFLSALPPAGKPQSRTGHTKEDSKDEIIERTSGDHLGPNVDSNANGFHSFVVPHESNPFEELLKSVEWLGMGKGRRCNILVKPDEMRGIPIVRTTTKYSIPAQSFRSMHVRLAEQIQRRAGLPAECAFNNALIENCDLVDSGTYGTLGFHSEQEADLEADTYIALFSCYKYPDMRPLRKLVAESKEPGGSKYEIPLVHGSVVLWSLDTNRRFKHKIVLERARGVDGKLQVNQWLGITFRTSKTFVQLCDGQARFEDGTALTLATDEQKLDFFKMRRREIEEIGFVYSPFSYTISESDLLPPAPAHLRPEQISCVVA